MSPAFCFFAMLPIASALNAERRRMSSKRPPPAWHAALMLEGITEADVSRCNHGGAGLELVLFSVGSLGQRRW